MIAQEVRRHAHRGVGRDRVIAVCEREEDGRRCAPSVRQVEQDVHVRLVTPALEVHAHFLSRRESVQRVLVDAARLEPLSGRRGRHLAVHLALEQREQLGPTVASPFLGGAHGCAVRANERIGERVRADLALVVVDASAGRGLR